MPRTGVLMINTGTPDEPTVEAVRRYLGEFLSDRELVSVPPFVWKHVLKHILKRRPQRTVHLYEQIWTEDGSPFMLASQRQRDALDAELRSRGFAAGDFQVELAMRYGNPSIASGLERLRSAGCERLVLLPMYPQYVKVCAGTVLKEAQRRLDVLAADGWKPPVVAVKQFHRDPDYIQALVDGIRERWTYEPGKKLVLSWHSTLVKDIENGDPYATQNMETAQAVVDALGIAYEDWIVAYQSRFDNRKWLGPLLGEVLPTLGELGHDDVCVVTPGFTAECLETLVEIGAEHRMHYSQAAPDESTFTLVPALNDAPGLVRALANAVEAADEMQVV